MVQFMQTHFIKHLMMWTVSVSKDPENCKMEQQTSNFYGIKSKEQGNKYTAQRWLGVWGSVGCAGCVSGQAEHFWLLTWHPGRRHLF